MVLGYAPRYHAVERLAKLVKSSCRPSTIAAKYTVRGLRFFVYDACT